MDKKDIKVFLGDQSPNDGGSLRKYALQEKGYGVTYTHQDADTFSAKARGKSGFDDNGFKIEGRVSPKYWAMAARNPFSPAVDGGNQKVNEKIRRIMKDAGLEQPVNYLTSKTNDKIFYGDKNKELWEKYMKEIIAKEKSHIEAVADIIGVSIKDVDPEKYYFSKNKEINSLTEYFKEESISEEMISRYGKENFWVMFEDKNDGFWKRRSMMDIDSGDEIMDGNEIIVPKGMILPIVLWEQGKTVGYSGMSYLDDLLKKRDEVSPQTSAKTLEIKFDWQPEALDIKDIIKEVVERTDLKGLIKDQQVEEVADKWKSRPTSIAYDAFGGDLNPDIKYEER